MDTTKSQPAASNPALRKPTLNVNGFFRGGAERSAPLPEGGTPPGRGKSQPSPSSGRKPSIRPGLAKTPDEVKQEQPGALYWNIRGLIPMSNKTKVSYLRDLAILKNPFFIILTETHLSDAILTAEINISGYTVFRSDRAGRSHGGTAAYVRNDLACQVLLSESNSVCESLVLKVKSLETILVSMYRPPDSSLEEFGEALGNVKVTIDKAVENDPKMKNLLQVGDFNFPFVDWKNRSAYKTCPLAGRKANDKKQAELLIEHMDELYMENCCLKPTRGQNILDLVLSNNLGMFGEVSVLVSQSISDHNLLEIPITHSYNQPKQSRSKERPFSTKIHEYEFWEADEEDWMRYGALMEDIDWDHSSQGLDVGGKLELFYELLEDVVSKVFKKKEEFSEKEDADKRTKNKIPKQVRLLMRQKKEISNRMMNSKSWLKTLKLTRQLEDKEKQLMEKYKERKMKVENDALEKMKTNPRYFYAFAKTSAKSKSTVGTLVSKDGKLCSTAAEKSECLREQFESVFTKPDERFKIENIKTFCNIGDVVSSEWARCGAACSQPSGGGVGGAPGWTPSSRIADTAGICITKAMNRPLAAL